MTDKLNLYPINELDTTFSNKIDILGIISRNFNSTPEKRKVKYILTFTIKGMTLLY